MVYLKPRLFELDAGPKNDRINLRLSQRQWDDLKKHCERNGLQQNHFIRHTIIAKILAMEPFQFKKYAYAYAQEPLENPRSISLNKDLKAGIMRILEKSKGWDLNSYCRLAIAEKINLPKKP